MATLTDKMQFALPEMSDRISPQPYNDNFSKIDDVIGRLTVDFIYQQGYESEWYVRRWASGLVEMHRTKTAETGAWSWWYPSKQEWLLYANNVLYLDYPSSVTFTSEPMEYASIQPLKVSTPLWLINDGHQTKTRSCNYWITSSSESIKNFTSDMKYKVDMHVVGFSDVPDHIKNLRGY